MLDDPLILEAVDNRGVISSLSSHAPLAKPAVSIEYLRQPIRYAAEVGAPMIMLDDGPTPDWTTEDENYALMRYTLREAAAVAERRGIKIAIETHGTYTTAPRERNLVDSPVFAINLDNANNYLSENDPAGSLEATVGQGAHPHTKNISRTRMPPRQLRGLLGYSCGQDIIDWARIDQTLAGADHDVALSIECGSLKAAHESYAYLSKLIAEIGQGRTYPLHRRRIRRAKRGPL